MTTASQPLPEAERTGGCGLFLVGQLACRRGVADTTVWFELAGATS